MIKVDDTVKADKGSATITSSQSKESIEKTLHPLPTEIMEKVRKREKDNSGFTDIDDVNWDKFWSHTKESNYTGIKEDAKITNLLIFVMTISRTWDIIKV